MECGDFVFVLDMVDWCVVLFVMCYVSVLDQFQCLMMLDGQLLFEDLCGYVVQCLFKDVVLLVQFQCQQLCCQYDLCDLVVLNVLDIGEFVLDVVIGQLLIVVLNGKIFEVVGVEIMVGWCVLVGLQIVYGGSVVDVLDVL